MYDTDEPDIKQFILAILLNILVLYTLFSILF